MKIFILIVLFIIYSNINSQEPSIEWTNTYSLDNSLNEIAFVRTQDGEYIFITDDFSFWYMWVLKINSDFEIAWKKKLDLKELDLWGFFPKKIVETSQNEFLIAIDLSRDFSALIKIDSNANIIDTIKIDMNHIGSIVEIPENNYLLCGSTWIDGQSFGWIKKINADLKEEWSLNFGDENWNGFTEMLFLNNNIYASGSKGEGWQFSMKAWLIKTDLNGELIWENTFGKSNYNGFNSIKAAADNDIALAGFTVEQGYDFWLVKIGENGVLIWEKIYNSELYNEASDVYVTSDKGYLLTGTKQVTSEFPYDYDVMVIKTNKEGEQLWSKQIGNSEMDEGYFGYELDQDNFIFAGMIDNDPSLTLLNSIVLEVISNTKVYDHHFVFQNYPNPFNPSTIIKYTIPNVFIPSGVEGALVQLKVYNVLGKEIATLVNKKQSPGNYQVEFDASTSSATGISLPSGVYFYRLQVYTPGRADNFLETKKMILLR